MEQLLLFLAPIMESYLGKYGVALQIVSYIGTLRLIMKPLMSIAHAIVEKTPSTSDDLKLKQFEESKLFKGFMYSLDWLASLKFKKPEVKK